MKKNTKIKTFGLMSMALLGGATLATIPFIATSCRGFEEDTKYINLHWTSYDDFENDFANTQWRSQYTHNHEFKDYRDLTPDQAADKLSDDIHTGDILLIAMSSIYLQKQLQSPDDIFYSISIMVEKENDNNYDISICFYDWGSGDGATTTQYFYTAPGCPCHLKAVSDVDRTEGPNDLWTTDFIWHASGSSDTNPLSTSWLYGGSSTGSKEGIMVMDWSFARYIFNCALPTD